MNFGIDFDGGTLVELRAKTGVADLTALRGIGDKLGLGAVEVQGFGNQTDATVRVRVQPGGDGAQQVAVDKLRDRARPRQYDFRRVEVVGPRVSARARAIGHARRGACRSSRS